MRRISICYVLCHVYSMRYQEKESPIRDWADTGFFLGGGAPLRNDVTDWRGKQILKANTKKKKTSSRRDGAHPQNPPP